MDKECPQCREVKSPGDYYKSNARTCKVCVRANVRKNRLENIEYYRQYDRDRASRPERRELNAKTCRRIRKSNPQKYKAQTAVNNAIRARRLVRGSCEVCGTKENVHGHHEDYSKPLDVFWLCPVHHKQAHHKGIDSLWIPLG